MPFPLTAAIGAGASLIGGLVGFSSNSSTNKANMELARYQNEWNEQMWNKQNEYNLPVNQMQRFKDAGLNPNLIYGQGNSGNASSAPAAAGATLRPYTGWNAAINSAASNFVALRNSQAQLENIQAQTANTNQDTLNKGAALANIKSNTARSQFDLNIAQKLEQTTLDAAKANLAQIQSQTQRNTAEISFMDFRKELSLAQINQLQASTDKLRNDMDFDQFERNLKRMGIYPGDNLYIRVVGRVLDALGISPKGLDNLFNPQ